MKTTPMTVLGAFAIGADNFLGMGSTFRSQLSSNQQLGVIAYELSSPLNNDNSITLGYQFDDKVIVNDEFFWSHTQVQMNRVQPDDAFLEALNNQSTQLIMKLKGKKITGDLKMAALGTVAHEGGTLRMCNDSTANEDDTCAVDPNLKAFGYSNLYFCDMSVMPSIPSANPSKTLVALARRLAYSIAKQFKEDPKGLDSDCNGPCCTKRTECVPPSLAHSPTLNTPVVAGLKEEL